MKLRIGTKLFIAMLLSLVIPLGAMMASVHWSFRRGFSDYLHQVDLDRLGKLVNRLGGAYTEHGGWQFLQEDPRIWRDLLFEALEQRAPSTRSPAPGYRPFPPPRMPGESDPAFSFGSPPPGEPRPDFRPPPPVRDPLMLGLRVRLLAGDQQEVVSPPPPFRDEPRTFEGASLLPIKVDGREVGWLQVSRNTLVSDRLALAFVEQQARSNLLILVLALAGASIGSVVLARQIIRPLRRIAAGTKRLASGHFDVSLPGGGDELGDLARDFNLLALSLERNEQLRRQWVADISHELRTPVAVLRGEIEALQDGVRQPTPERIESIHDEVLSLNKLVDDLYDLSLSDLGTLSYQREHLDVSALLVRSVDSFRGRLDGKGIGLTADIPPGARILGDRQRLTQLFGNLLENTFRYTNGNGRCHVALAALTDKVVVTFEDSAPGVPAAALDHLFERFYRVEDSRSREHGGSGLGLAICGNIVEAHGGRIEAGESNLGGLRVRIELPLLDWIGGQADAD